MQEVSGMSEVRSTDQGVRSLYRPSRSTSGAMSRPSRRRISVLSLISRLPRSIRASPVKPYSRRLSAKMGSRCHQR
jgi:hypothetical protein